MRPVEGPDLLFVEAAQQESATCSITRGMRAKRPNSKHEDSDSDDDDDGKAATKAVTKTATKATPKAVTKAGAKAAAAVDSDDGDESSQSSSSDEAVKCITVQVFLAEAPATGCGPSIRTNAQSVSVQIPVDVDLDEDEDPLQEDGSSLKETILHGVEKARVRLGNPNVTSEFIPTLTCLPA